MVLAIYMFCGPSIIMRTKITPPRVMYTIRSKNPTRSPSPLTTERERKTWGRKEREEEEERERKRK